MLEIALLGELRVTADGVDVEALHSPRTLGLLAYLGVHAGTPQLRQHIAGVFWPDSTDAQARTNLRRELHNLRVALPDADRCIAVDAHTLRWRSDAPCTLDVAEFQAAATEAEAASAVDAFEEAATRAVRSYGGDLAPAFYDDWVEAARVRLRRRCVALLDRLTAHLAAGDRDQLAVDYARRRVELEPLEESGYRVLMAAQARTGDRAAALRTFHRCSTALERELGVGPSAKTIVVHDELLVSPADHIAATPELRTSSPLVGRVGEMSMLHTAWADVAHGARLVAVVGEAGVGKTRLLAELATLAERSGGLVARARCFASQGRLALGPVVEWLRNPGHRRHIEHLRPVWRREVGRLVPEFAGDDEPARPAGPVDGWLRRQFFEAVARALVLAERPTLLVLDDLQWCDSETLAWLDFLLDSHRDAPLLVATSVRIEELGDNSDLVTWWRRRRAAALVDEIALEPLSVTETAELASALGNRTLDEEQACRLQAETGGFPLFVVEASRGGALRSRRVDAVLAGRFAQLSPRASELAGVAAAVGRDFSMDTLAAATGIDDDTLVAAVDELWRRRLLREHSATTYDFSHDLLRAVAYDTLTPPHRRLTHQRIAEALARVEDSARRHAAVIADQFELGGDRERAIHYHTLAAEVASEVFAVEDAVRHYQRALGLLSEMSAGDARDRIELGLQLAIAPHLNASVGYSAPELGTRLRAAIALAERLGEPELALRSKIGLFTHLFVVGHVHECRALATDLLDRAVGQSDVTAQIHFVNAASLGALGQATHAIEHFAAAYSRAAGEETLAIGVNIQLFAQAWQAHPLWIAGRGPEARTSAATAIALADEIGNPYGQTVATAYGAVTHHLLGDVEQSREQAAAVRVLCGRYGFAYYDDWARIVEGRCVGGVTGAALVREGIDRLAAQQAGARMPFWLAQLAEVLARAGRSREAASILVDARALAERHGDLWWLPELWRLDAGPRHDRDAEPMLRHAVSVARAHGAVALELRAAADLARRLVDAGRGEEAAELLHGVMARSAGCNQDDLAAAEAVLAGTNR